MKTSELAYELPADRIAQQPAARRDASRLLIVDRHSGHVRQGVFSRLAEWLPPRCLLVLNDTQVLPARLRLRRPTGGHIEGLYLREVRPGLWEIMLTGSGRVRAQERLSIEGTPRSLRLIRRVEAGIWEAEPVPNDGAFAILAECGRPPLPPYIDRSGAESVELDTMDRQRYQTIYAAVPGAVAAPTAGLHFTPEVFAALDAAGIERVTVTLHVGVGTFAPIRCESLADHRMHAEYYECTAGAAEAVNTARAAGRAIVAVGTTAVRVLETCADAAGRVAAGAGWTTLFIYPPYRFRAVDAMITNFHLPGSTLLAMVFALAGRQHVLDAYNAAIREGYRFYSYGDAMLIRSGVEG